MIFNRENSLFFHKDHLLKAQQFYEKHGGKTIILARFMPIIRTFAPVVAGVGRMHYPRFLLFNVVGGIGWVFSMVLIGYYSAERAQSAAVAHLRRRLSGAGPRRKDRHRRRALVDLAGHLRVAAQQVRGQEARARVAARRDQQVTAYCSSVETATLDPFSPRGACVH